MAIDAPSESRRTEHLGLPAASLGAVLVVPLATATATWWLIGDRSLPSDRRHYLDYFWPKPALPPVFETLVGALAALLLLGCVGVLMRATRWRAMDQRWWAVTCLLGAAGLVTGMIVRSLSAGFPGASTGGDLLVPLGLPLGAGLVLAAAVVAGRIAGTRRTP